MFVGGLLLFMGLTASILKRSAITSAIIYLPVGVLVGPAALDLFHFNPLKESALLEVLTEIAVLISLFFAGIKMPAPFTLARWRAPILLATISMTITVAAIAAFVFLRAKTAIGCRRTVGSNPCADRSGAGNRCANSPPRRSRPIVLQHNLRSRHEQR